VFTVEEASPCALALTWWNPCVGFFGLSCLPSFLSEVGIQGLRSPDVVVLNVQRGALVALCFFLTALIQ
jgi:hypothetical protein